MMMFPTAVVWAFFVFLSLIWPHAARTRNAAEAAILFLPTNVEHFSLYQTAEITFSSNTLQGDPPITSRDWFYFVEDAGDVNCNQSVHDDRRSNKFYVTATSTNGISGRSTVVVRETDFRVGGTYVICYVTEGKPHVARRSSVDDEGILRVWSSIYNEYNVKPTPATGGLAFVELTVVETTQSGRSSNGGLNGRDTIFFLPCEDEKGEDRCRDINNLPEACAKSSASGIQLSNLKKGTRGSSSVTGSFTVPYAPSASGYFICVPYCYSAALDCGTSGRASYNVVTGTEGGGNGVAALKHVVKFGEANPSRYSLTPTAPQAREEGDIWLFGTDLAVGDEVRVIRADTGCGSLATLLLTNLEVGKVEVVNKSAVRVPFRAPNFITGPMSGQVCYRRGGSQLWSSVYKDAKKTEPDFVVDVFQPTEFRVVPEHPAIGLPFTIIFHGTGLSSQDDIFLSRNSSCDSKLQEKFVCRPSSVGNSECNVLVDPPFNYGITVHVCYRKAGRRNYAAMSSTISLSNRNPTFTLSPYPLYAGQRGKLTFLGQGLSLMDTVGFVPTGMACSENAFVKTFSIKNGVEVELEKAYAYEAIGKGGSCLQVCYKTRGSNDWFIARSQQIKSDSERCMAGNLYIHTYAVRYELPHASVTAKETITVKLMHLPMVSALKVVRASDDCALSFCSQNGVLTTACTLAQREDDFASFVDGKESQVVLGAPNTDYIVCASTDGDAFIPVQSTQNEADPTKYALRTTPAKVTLSSYTPQQWRVAHVDLRTTFTGTGLDRSKDKVYAVLGSDLLSASALACPPANVPLREALLSHLEQDAATSTSVVARYANSHLRRKGDVVHFCYVWGGEGEHARVTHTGAITFGARSPLEMKLVLPSLHYARAGERVQLSFTFDNTTHTHSPEKDSVYFYRFASTMSQECYCDERCAQEARVVYPDVLMTANAFSSETIWMRPEGFDNYNFDATYVVCYSAAGSEGATYLGQLNIGMAQPTYYVAESNSGEYRVGDPITLKAIQLCRQPNCTRLHAGNSMRVIPSTKQCYQISGDGRDPNDSTETIGRATVDYTTYTQRVVVNKAGSYRVCYRREIEYHELTGVLNASPRALVVQDANPFSFTPIPALPSAGVFTSVQLNCGVGECRSCEKLRLVPGVMSSCWEEVKNTFANDKCEVTTIVQFPNQYLTEGSYTVCYGDKNKSRRVPGTLTVLPANPSEFTTSVADIYPNQYSDVTVTVSGNGLSGEDKIFLITTRGYTCHDLRKNELQSNGTLKKWFAPSVDPNPLEVSVDRSRVTWVVSNQKRRFDDDLLSDPTFCDKPNEFCTMQLCYMRHGSTWAPVSSSRGQTLRLLPSNPSRVFFEQSPLTVGVYSLVRVFGKDLSNNDVLMMRLNNCDGKAITVPVGTASVNGRRTEWTGVVRFTERAMENLMACYTHKSSTTQIGTVNASGAEDIVVLEPLYYMYDTGNLSNEHEMTQYEELMVTATFLKEIRNDLRSVDIIDINTECNYMPYYNTAGLKPEFAVVRQLEPLTKPYFGGRLDFETGRYAFCMRLDIGLFRVTTRINKTDFILGKANPASYTAYPIISFPNQPFQLIFSVLNDNVGGNDLVQIIDGTLYECGSRNKSVLFEAPAVADRGASRAVVEGITLPPQFIDRRLTVCYRRVGGTFATVPRDGQVDRNLVSTRQIPGGWMVTPTQPQVTRTLKITFLGNKDYPGFLTKDDRVSLVPATKDMDTTCTQGGAALSTNSVLMEGVNTVWVISPNDLKEGKYIVCYTPANGGSVMRVENPVFLTLYPLQSPKGIYRETGASVDIFSGERFYLMFDSDVLLNPVLSSSEDARGKDAVLFSRTSDCTTPLKSTEVDVIPSDFHYKPLELKNPSGIPVPYLHLVMRTFPGSFFVCMRRVGRAMGEAFFGFEAIGDIRHPAMVKVTEMPITSYVTRPQTPRAWIPSVSVQSVFSAQYNEASFSQLFFVSNTDTNNYGEMRGLVDNCYRPTAKEAATREAVLLNTTLQVVRGTNYMQFPFPTGGPFRLCLQLGGVAQHAASVGPPSLRVRNPSPTAYIVPEIIHVQESFTMAFYAVDEIFRPRVTRNKVRLFLATDDVVSGKAMPKCEDDDAPNDSRISFDTLFRTNNTFASVQPKIHRKGYFYVCFFVFDQPSFFPVPNAEGGYVFSVGLIGAQRYVVGSSFLYMGQTIEITIFGNLLSNKDHVKIVKVPFAVDTSETRYDALCTESAHNIDAEVGGTTGSVVTTRFKTQALYTPRVNMTGRFVLCYQSAPLGNNWKRVADLKSFTVDAPHPATYRQTPMRTYATEVSLLYIERSLLGDLLDYDDEVKLVARGRGITGFDCSEADPASPHIGALQRVESKSSGFLAVYQMCATKVTQVTVCYRFKGSTWAEVPLRSPPPNYVFSPIRFLDSPFSGPRARLSAPRPYEPFVLEFWSSDHKVSVNHLGFVLGAQPPCALNLSYVKPVYYEKNRTKLNTFTVALPKAGTYQLYLGAHEAETDPCIAHRQTFVVAPCDPCSFTPSYTFIGNSVTVVFPGKTETSLSRNDTVRIVPVSQGLEGLPCEKPDGSFASLTLTPDLLQSSSEGTFFTFYTGDSVAYAGDYYLCYRRAASDSNYAIVTDENAQPLKLSIYPTPLMEVGMCPPKPSYLEMITLNVTFPSAKYPKLVFSGNDEFLLLPPYMECGAVVGERRGGGGGAGGWLNTDRGVIRPKLGYFMQNNMAVWVSTLPNGHAETEYKMCFRLAEDAVFRVLTPSTLKIAPQDPSYVVMQPTFVEPNGKAFKLHIHGQDLSENDDVYVVEPSERCDERCGEKLAPKELESAPYKKRLVNQKLLELDFNGGINKDGVMAVCYRRAKRQLVRLAVYFFGDRNPKSYKTDFVPRVGTRPLITFQGTDLTAEDRVIVVGLGMNCDESRAVAIGKFVSVFADGSQSSFHVPLVGEGVVPGSYTVCYFVKGTPGYATMKSELEIQSGGPSSFKTSNTPMVGRSTEITFDDNNYVSKVGDEAILACGGCSCFDGVAAILPYGTSHAKANANGEAIGLRVGLSDRLHFAVCYRLADSGYAQVGTRSIRPVVNSPSVVSVVPSPFIFQGQRLTFTLTGFGSRNLNKRDVVVQVPNANDKVMLVTQRRMCWDRPEMDQNDILAQPSEVVSVTETQSTWRGHVPSLGPDARPVKEFPILFTLCYRENGQNEYVVVPFPLEALEMNPADPSTYVTFPKAVSLGMVRMNMMFSASAAGDTTYIVKTADDKLTINNACDNVTSQIVSAVGPALPRYTFSFPPQLANSFLVVCYKRVNSTVAEVPQLLNVFPRNPTGYTTNVPLGSTAKERQYIVFTFTGTNLDPFSDRVVFTDVPCASSSTWPPISAPFVRRVGDLITPKGKERGTSVEVVAQFVGVGGPFTAHVCYFHEGVWREVGDTLLVAAPAPTSLSLNPRVGLARVGQHIRIKLDGMDQMVVPLAAVISADDGFEGSWCHNFTGNYVREPLLKVVNSSDLDVPIWHVAGPARVCVKGADSMWADVALTPDGLVSDVIVSDPNPSSMSIFPRVPRVGQQVTLTFNMLTPSNERDKIRITQPDDATACEDVPPIAEFPLPMSVKPDNTFNTSTITLQDETDPFKYRSFKTHGSFQVCYYSAVENTWSLVGGSVKSASFLVSPMVPTQWSSEKKNPRVFSEKFVLVFEDAEGNLDAFGDRVWAVPKSKSCGLSHDTCSQCIFFDLDPAKSSPTFVVTRPAVSFIAGELNLCYRLRDATAAMLERPLEVSPGDVECYVEESLRVGQQQEVTFRKRGNVDVSTDSWRVSFFDTDMMDCDKGYDPHFPQGRATRGNTNDTHVVYGVEWPVAMVRPRYRVCYTHKGVTQLVCSCKQLETQSGECYISTRAASPLYFSPMPKPTYVGQWIELTFVVDRAMASYPITSVKFVEKKNELSACKDPEAFPLVPNPVVSMISATSFVYKFKHDYREGPGNLIVCALSPKLSNKYARVGTENPETSSNTLTLRPYLSLSTVPTSPDLIRAMQTITLTFTHTSTKEDDVVGLDDRVAFVKSPENCNEYSVDFVPSPDVPDIFVPEDTSFSSTPAPVMGVNNQARTSHIFVTFDTQKGLGQHTVCYKLKDGTWAPVLQSINVLPAAVTSCAREAATLDRLGNLRAMQYVPMILVGTKETGRYRSFKDAVRVVPQSMPCINTTGTEFGVKIINQENTSIVLFTPREGMFKVCYRLGAAHDLTVNWSPVCTKLTFTPLSPTATFTGCLRLGQTLNVRTVHHHGLSFLKGDSFRFVSGTEHCIYADNTQPVSNTIMVGHRPQDPDGTVVDSAANWFNIPPALLGEGTTSVRLCYKDVAGNHFAVPLGHGRSDASEYVVAGRLITSLEKQCRIMAGQRVILTFHADGSREKGQLKPFAELPNGPFKPIQPYDGQYDGASALRLASSGAYREGRCYEANPSLDGVYGNKTMTFGAFDPVTSGMHVACYKSAGCSVEDVGLPFVVGNYNPERFSVDSAQPRYGQLLRVTFFGSKKDMETQALKPGADRAEVLLGSSSCWDLSAKEGKPVDKASENSTSGVFFFAAPPPEYSGSSTMTICYLLESGSWSNLPNNRLTLHPANPSQFFVLNFPARMLQINYIVVRGLSLSANDRVKVIAKSDVCDVLSVPPSGIMEYNPDMRDHHNVNLADGWKVINATPTKTLFAVNSTREGRFSVCYRLAKDKVWTLVYDDLVIYPRDPETVEQTPASVAEGEVFTLNFKSVRGSSSLTKDDRVVLYTGIVSCHAPHSDTDAIITSPSRTDKMPNQLFFQLAVGTRGNYTLCYLKGDGVTIAWGFDPVEIIPNPWNYTIIQPRTTLPRANQLIRYLFWGSGLFSKTNEGEISDQVKLIDASNPQTDEACQTAPSAVQVEYYPLEANGTHAVQTVIAPPTAAGSFWVCYKLSGGRFYSMKGAAVSLAKEDPFDVKRKKRGAYLWDGEADTWTLKTRQLPVKEALLFYSVVRCNDFPYYVMPDVLSNKFTYGVAVVQNNAAVLRAGLPTKPTETLSLCYYADGVTTRLVDSVFKVEKGVPPPLRSPVSAKALQIFQFDLAVASTSLDYVVLVADADRCVGKTAPTPSDDVFVNVENGRNNILVTTAVEKKGTYYICYSHHAGRCATGEMQECARIVGTVVASAPNPFGWSITPETVYTTDLVTIQLLRSKEITQAQASERLWLTPLNARAGVSAGKVASACIRSMNEGNRMNLQQQGDTWKIRLNDVGVYALCYTSDGDLLPTIFPPLSNTGLVVHLTRVSSVTFMVTPTVDTENTIILHGGGLSQEDQVVAVGVPSTTNIPANVCNDPSYAPRVAAVKSNAGYGLSTMAVHVRFEKLGHYVLCFRAASSKDPFVLITYDAFEVTSMPLSFKVLSATLKNSVLKLEFLGKELNSGDTVALIPAKGGGSVSKRESIFRNRAALVFAEDSMSDDGLVLKRAALRSIRSPSKSSNDICKGGEYKAVTSASEDGTTSFFRTVLHSTGTYAVCYAGKSLSLTLLENEIEVTERTATGATFTVVPTCTALCACSPQPVVALTDASGRTTSDLFATVVMRLRLANGTAVDHLLSGESIYTQKDYREFYFVLLTVLEPGTYIMEAEFTLRDGVKLFARSPPIVIKSREHQDVAVVTCQPTGIIERSEANPLASNITCTIKAKSALAPTAYTVRLNAGTSTEVVRDNTSKGLPQYRFTVFPPHDDPTIEFLVIYTEASSPPGNCLVTNSPVVVRIGSQPEEGSTLSCVPDPVDFSLPTLVRIHGRLVCHVQGKRRIGDVEQDIVAMPKYMRVFSEYDKSDTTRKVVNVGDYSVNLDGNYMFGVNVSRAKRSLSIFGSVPLRRSSNTYIPMKKSPIEFTVIGNPQLGDSSIFCVSGKSGSRLWFTPAEPFTCTLSLRADGHLVNGVPQDFLVKIQPGGSVQLSLNETWGTRLSIYGAAPPLLNPGTNQAVSDQDFDVSVTFSPLMRLIALTSGKLVYATSIHLTEHGNNRILIALNGSGLSRDHKYGVRPTVDCASGVEKEAAVTGVNTSTDDLQLDVTTPNGPFYVCFAPSDKPTRWQLLTNEVLRSAGRGGGVNMWTILLILAVILLAILLGLFIALLWHVCRSRRHKAATNVAGAVYMPPRTNHRFVRGAASDVRRRQTSFTSPPPSQQQPTVEETTKRGDIEPRINVSNSGVKPTNIFPEKNGEVKAYHPRPSEFEKRSEHSANKKGPLHDDLYSSDSDEQVTRFVPPAPPLHPSGPYQHLHHENDLFSPRSGGEEIEEERWVGPFVVRGHTSRPLVNSTHTSNSPADKNGAAK